MKTMKFVKGVGNIIQAKRTTEDADSNVYRSSDNALDRYMVVGARQIAEEICIQPVDQEWMKKPWFSPYYLNAVNLKKYDRVDPF